MKLDYAAVTTTLVARWADIRPNSFQTYTVVAACLFIPISGLIWFMPLLKEAFVGPKIFVIFTHEAFHVITGVLCSGRLTTFVIDPNSGGHTGFDSFKRTLPRVVDPYIQAPAVDTIWWSRSYTATLLMGSFGSAVVGFLYVFAAFDIVASKIASFTIAIGLLVAGWWAMHWVAYVSVFCSEAVLVGLWFGAHGSALRFLVLLFGVMHLFYAVWDYLEDAVTSKPNPSDSQLLMHTVGLPMEAWFALLFIFESLVFMAAIIAGIAVFKKSTEEMYANAAGFLPTR